MLLRILSGKNFYLLLMGIKSGLVFFYKVEYEFSDYILYIKCGKIYYK